MIRMNVVKAYQAGHEASLKGFGDQPPSNFTKGFSNSWKEGWNKGAMKNRNMYKIRKAAGTIIQSFQRKENPAEFVYVFLNPRNEIKCVYQEGKRLENLLYKADLIAFYKSDVTRNFVLSDLIQAMEGK